LSKILHLAVTISMTFFFYQERRGFDAHASLKQVVFIVSNNANYFL